MKCLTSDKEVFSANFWAGGHWLVVAVGIAVSNPTGVLTSNKLGLAIRADVNPAPVNAVHASLVFLRGVCDNGISSSRSGQIFNNLNHKVIDLSWIFQILRKV